MNKYNEIIDLKHFEPKNHTRMSIYERSAQFAPFAALTGYNEIIDDANIIDDKEIILDDSEKEKINNELIKINDDIKNNNVTITYLNNEHNHKKYITKKVEIKKIDFINNEIILTNKKKISMNDIKKIKPNS